MTKYLCMFLFSVALVSTRMLAQASPGGPGWIAVPGSAPISVYMNRPEGQTGPIVGKPFSAAEMRFSQNTLANGTHVSHSDMSQFYRDAQGRMRSESSGSILIYDPVAGFTYQLDPQAKTYAKWPIRPGVGATSIATVGEGSWIYNRSKSDPLSPVESTHAVGGRLPPHTYPVAHTQTEELKPEVINGVSCKGSRVTMTIPAAAMGSDHDIEVVNERWYSDDLKVLVKSSNSDPRFGFTSYQLVNIKQVAPDSALFQIPAGYTLETTESH